MSANGEVLGELIKAKENIKRKYTALKHGKADIHSIVTETFNPIIAPLNEIKNYKSTTSQPIEFAKDIQDIQDIDAYDSQDFKISDWFKSYDIDKTYGPKKQTNPSVQKPIT